jgi:glucose-6-phosphate isomerase
MSKLTQSDVWKKPKEHQLAVSGKNMRTMFEEDSDRFDKFSLKFNNILLDY